MRFVATALLLASAVGLSLTPAHASNVVFYGFHCPQHLACDASDPSFPNQQSIIAATNACISNNMNVTSAQSFFNDSAGLDSSGCLSTNESTFRATGITTATPHCCIESLPNGNCAMHCSLIGE